MGQFGMGQPVRRVEDQRLLTGGGRYTDDINLPGQAYGVVLGSPYAHAKIKSIDTAAAKGMPGVLAVYTVDDLKAAGVNTLLPVGIELKNRDGSPMAKLPRPVLADGVVRHTGEPVAFIVAETPEQARDAAEAVEVDYDDLPSVAGTAEAVEASAAQIFPNAPGNVCFDWGQGDPDKTEAALKAAPHTLTFTLINNRVVSNPMEPRNALGGIEPDGRLVLYTSSQGSHGLQANMGLTLNIDPKTIRVVTPDVGGGFGTKIFPYPEQPLVLFAAKQLGRAVKWSGERADSFLTDVHGRDNVTTATIGFDDSGKFLGLAVDTIANLGAYLSFFGPYIPTKAGTGMLTGVYAIPTASVRVRGVFTNTTPIDAYRGAGRPEAAFVIERMTDLVAKKVGRSPADVRRINFVKPAQMPYTTAFGMIYDSGDFAQNMDDALAKVDVAGLPARKAAAKARGKLRGLGISTYIEACSGGGDERATVTIEPTGKVRIAIGTQNNGQGHATAYAQIAADKLGIDIGQIEVIQGDTDQVATGRGTGGSRSVPVAGSSLDLAAGHLIEKGKRLAGHYLEAAAADIEYADGTFRIAGTDRAMSLIDVAARAVKDVPAGETAGLDGTEAWTPPHYTFPNGCHAVEVEVDPDTGVTSIVNYIVVDDFGTILNPLMLAGQVHGGIAQGVGQALMEGCVYDEGSGQLLTGSFMDYAMPRADHLPMIDFTTNVVPCKTNHLGMKGAGEAGAIGAPPAVISALADALSEYGIAHVDMPATPEKVWRLIQSAKLPQAAE